MNGIQFKVQEARYFLNQLSNLVAKHDEFRFNLSAFLSAARSNIQILRDKYLSKPRFQAWYDNTMSDDLLRFFRDTRDVSVHEGLVSLNKEIEEGVVERIDYIEESGGTYTVRASATGEASEYFRPIVAIPMDSKLHIRTNFYWKFDDFPDDIDHKNDVIDLCNKYLERIEKLITDANDTFEI